MKQSVMIGPILSAIEFGEYLEEEGVSIEPQLRNSKEVTTLNGKLYRKGNLKYNVTLNFLEMSDDYYRTLMAKLPTPNNTVLVRITNLQNGTTISGQFYVSNNSYTAKKVYGTLHGTPITTISGVSITLEQE